jgi:hypothetical protein
MVAIVAAATFALPAFCADPPASPPAGTPPPAAPPQAAHKDNPTTEQREAEGRLVRKTELAQYAKKADIDALIAQMQDLLAQIRAIRARLEGSGPDAAPAKNPPPR